jgi:hypothetical protein
VATLQVRRWTRGLHDRLYVSTVSGLKVGWYDLRSHREHLDVPGMWPEFRQAVSRWQADQRGARPNGSAVHVPVSLLPPAGGPDDRTTAVQWLKLHGGRAGGGVGAASLDEDLAARRPGHNVTAMAEALRPRWRGVRVLARLLGVRTRDRSWRVGAAGESAVGARLDRLVGRGWRVLHGVSLGGGGDVDHLLIGPPGVLVVNTKHHPGARVRVGRDVVFVRGRATTYVGRAHREAERVRLALAAAWDRQLHVAPVLVFHGHRSLQGWVARRPRAVQVLPSWAVTWWCRLPGRPVLDSAAVEELFDLARRPATWARV